MYRLLIVDDEKDICENARYLLDWASYGITSVMTATSYSEALDKAIDFKPHIALIDVSLGDYKGYDLIEQLRAVGLETVFCMISGYDDFRYIQRSLQASARDYLLKPINVKELQAFVERTIVQDLHGTLPQTMANTAYNLDPVLKTEYSQYSKITQKILTIVKNNYRSSLTLTSIGEMFNMSSKYIGRIFLKDTGMKFTKYLTAYRMTLAYDMIKNTQEKISAIAYMVGYSQLNNFYVHFKEYHNISPGSLRNYEAEEADADSEKGVDASC